MEATSNKKSAVRQPTPISKTIQIRRTRQEGHGQIADIIKMAVSRMVDQELISDIIESLLGK